MNRLPTPEPGTASGRCLACGTPLNSASVGEDLSLPGISTSERVEAPLGGEAPKQVIGERSVSPRCHRCGSTRQRWKPSPIAYQQVADALQRVQKARAHWAIKALSQFLAYSVARQGDARYARWDDIDRDQAVFTVPANRTKSGRPQRIPLNGPALGVLDDAWERTGGVGLVFPSATGQPISFSTVCKLLQTETMNSFPYEFRTGWRTWAVEQGVPDEVAELALGHTHKKVLPGIDLLEQLRAVMERWGHYLTGATGPDRPNPPPSEHNNSTPDEYNPEGWES